MAPNWKELCISRMLQHYILNMSIVLPERKEPVTKAVAWVVEVDSIFEMAVLPEEIWNSFPYQPFLLFHEKKYKSYLLKGNAVVFERDRQARMLGSHVDLALRFGISTRCPR